MEGHSLSERGEALKLDQEWCQAAHCQAGIWVQSPHGCPRLAPSLALLPQGSLNPKAGAALSLPYNRSTPGLTGYQTAGLEKRRRWRSVIPGAGHSEEPIWPHLPLPEAHWLWGPGHCPLPRFGNGHPHRVPQGAQGLEAPRNFHICLWPDVERDDDIWLGPWGSGQAGAEVSLGPGGTGPVPHHRKALLPVTWGKSLVGASVSSLTAECEGFQSRRGAALHVSKVGSPSQ